MRIVRKSAAVEAVDLGKRFYLPGVVLESSCPKCRCVWSLDLGSDYIDQYMSTETPIEVKAYCGCDGCDAEWVAGNVVFHVTIEQVIVHQACAEQENAMGER